MTKAVLDAPMDNQLNVSYQVPSNSNWDSQHIDHGVFKTTAWHYWQDWYYPNVIRESYPIYIRERSEDKGKQAFEIIKVLKDKKLVNLNKVGDFIDLMDELIKIL